jgi:hypothetical protein
LCTASGCHCRVWCFFNPVLAMLHILPTDDNVAGSRVGGHGHLSGYVGRGSGKRGGSDGTVPFWSEAVAEDDASTSTIGMFEALTPSRLTQRRALGERGAGLGAVAGQSLQIITGAMFTLLL